MILVQDSVTLLNSLERGSQFKGPFRVTRTPGFSQLLVRLSSSKGQAIGSQPPRGNGTHFTTGSQPLRKSEKE
jgi:hypothetical protein